MYYLLYTLHNRALLQYEAILSTTYSQTSMENRRAIAYVIHFLVPMFD